MKIQPALLFIFFSFFCFFSILFLPLSASADTIQYLITEAIPDHRTPSYGITFFTKDIDINYTSGNIILSGNSAGTGGTYVDDGLEITVIKPDGSSASHLYAGFNNPPIDVTYLFGVGINHVTVKLRDLGGAIIGSSAMYLVNTNVSETTAITDEVVFYDDFDGPSMDPNKWDISNLISGKRWCADSTNNFDLGVWFNLLNGNCHNLTQAPSLGKVEFRYSMGFFSSGSSRAFPYTWSSASQGIIPPSGDFTFETRMVFTSNAPHGTGIVVSNWKSPVAEGNNPPPYIVDGRFTIWSDSSLLNNVRLLDNTAQVSNLSWHTYRLEYKGNKYTLYVDTVKVFDQIDNDIRPNTVSIGNPLFAFWYAADWSDFQIDYIRVTKPGVSTPAPPVPFLDLPWNYDCKQAIDPELNEECEKTKAIKNFDFSAIQINSHFDHKYPFLCCGVLYSLDEPEIIDYKGKETKQGYSLHDGYDFGTPAFVEDGDPVLAAAAGEATFIHKDHSGGGGYVIKIDHGNGYQTIYEHIKLDKYIIIDNELGKVGVQKGQRIGSVGYDGNCYVEDRNGNRIYNTADCAHIHFGVIKDKEFIEGQSQPADFSDNIPDGLTDPYGWQPTKNENEKQEDPWEKLLFTYSGKERKGNKSYYLWTKKLPGVKDTVTSDGGTYTAGGITVKVEPDTFKTPVTLEAEYASSGKASNNIWSIGPVVDITVKNILGDLVTILTKPIQIWWFPFDDADLSRFKPGTFYLYSSKDRITWKQEQEVDPFTPGNITASANHLTYFAIMGERKDMIPPTTTPELNGLKGEQNWFRSDVNLILTATDSADMDPAGVKYTHYKINNGDWTMYPDQPILFTNEGHYSINFYSSDKDDNIEGIQSIEFDIDKTLPTINIDVNPKSIWPPNGKMEDIKITGSSSDENLKSTTFKVIDEYGEIEPIITEFNQTIQLEAKRDGKDKDGRKYVIKVIAVDKAGNISEAASEVIVPHDKGK